MRFPKTDILRANYADIQTIYKLTCQLRAIITMQQGIYCVPSLRWELFKMI
jgi:hypothetical protein